MDHQPFIMRRALSSTSSCLSAALINKPLKSDTSASKAVYCPRPLNVHHISGSLLLLFSLSPSSRWTISFLCWWRSIFCEINSPPLEIIEIAFVPFWGFSINFHQGIIREKLVKRFPRYISDFARESCFLSFRFPNESNIINFHEDKIRNGDLTFVVFIFRWRFSPPTKSLMRKRGNKEKWFLLSNSRITIWE